MQPPPPQQQQQRRRYSDLFPPLPSTSLGSQESKIDTYLLSLSSATFKKKLFQNFDNTNMEELERSIAYEENKEDNLNVKQRQTPRNKFHTKQKQFNHQGSNDSKDTTATTSSNDNNITSKQKKFHNWIRNMLRDSKAPIPQLQNQVRKVLSDMQAAGCEINGYTFNYIISGWLERGDIHEALRVLREDMPAAGVPADIIAYNSILHAMCRRSPVMSPVPQPQGLNAALSLIKEMRGETGGPNPPVQPDATTYNILINALAKSNKLEQAVSLLKAMRRSGFVPDQWTFSALIRGALRRGDIHDALSIIEVMNKSGALIDNVVSTMLIDAFCRARHPHRALALFARMKQQTDQRARPDRITYNALIDGLLKNNCLEEALMIANEFRAPPPEGLGGFDTVTYTLLIDYLCKVDAIELAEKYFAHMQDAGVVPNISTINALIGGYGRAGQFDKAIQLYLSMAGPGSSGKLTPTLATFVVLLDACGYKCNMDAAAWLWSEEMPRCGVLPHVRIFAAMLNVCSRCGDTKTGRKLFETMMHNGKWLPSHKVFRTIIKVYLENYQVEGLRQLVLDIMDEIVKFVTKNDPPPPPPEAHQADTSYSSSSSSNSNNNNNDNNRNKNSDSNNDNDNNQLLGLRKSDAAFIALLRDVRLRRDLGIEPEIYWSFLDTLKPYMRTTDGTKTAPAALAQTLTPSMEYDNTEDEYT